MSGVFFEIVDYRGRLNRGAYTRFLMFGFVVYVVMSILLMSGTIGATLHEDFPRWLFSGVRRIVMLGLAAAWLSATVRRLHDIGWTGAWALLIVPGWLARQLNHLDINPRTRDVLPDFVHPHMFDILLFGGVSAAVLLLFLILPGTDGPNRFDDKSVHKGWQRMRLSDPEAPPHTPVFDFGPPRKGPDDGPSGFGGRR